MSHFPTAIMDSHVARLVAAFNISINVSYQCARFTRCGPHVIKYAAIGRAHDPDIGHDDFLARAAVLVHADEQGFFGVVPHRNIGMPAGAGAAAMDGEQGNRRMAERVDSGSKHSSSPVNIAAILAHGSHYSLGIVMRTAVESADQPEVIQLIADLDLCQDGLDAWGKWFCDSETGRVLNSFFRHQGTACDF